MTSERSRRPRFDAGRPTQPGLVSVVIPCYNQAAYLGSAIESALEQSYPSVEVLVVDDGSTDGPAAVAGRYPAVRYLCQANAGPAAARNAGLRDCAGEYVVFLDADDVLLPDALWIGVGRLRECPACAFVAGRFRYVKADGSPSAEQPPPFVERDHYRELLQKNFVAMHATVLYRRAAVTEVGGFDPALRGCEDYDLMLRVARRAPVHTYPEVVAEYRRHASNATHDAGLMLRTAARVLRAARREVRGEPALVLATRRGVSFFASYYAAPLYFQTCMALRAGDWRRAARGALTLFRYAPGTALRLAARGVLARD